MRTTYWHKLAIVIPGICAGFLLFVGLAIPAHADETCLRGGDGNCVELLRQTSLVSGTAKYFTGQASATNFLSLQDGSMVALVGRFVASYGANGVNTINRYEIELQYSRDGGVTWEKPPITNKGHWYVDEHLPGSNSVEGSQPNGMDSGAGFLGFDVSSVYDSTTKKTYITLAHTIACPFPLTYNDGSITSFDEFNLNNCSSSSFTGDGTRTSGSVFIDTIVYDHTDYSFDQIGKTRSLTRSAATVPGEGGYSCSGGICYGAAWGADHPSISTTMIGTELRMWVAYSAFRGGDCPTFTGTWDRCKDQNLADYADGVRYLKNFWVRQVKINQSTGDLSAVNTVTPTSDNVSLQRLPQLGAGTSYDANFFSSKIGVLLTQYPIIMYSYSDLNSALYPLNWTYWTGSAWTVSQKVQGTDPSTIIKNSYSGIQNIVGAIKLASPSEERISTVSGVASGRYSTNSGSDFENYRVFHVAAYGTLASGAYVPVYIKFYMSAVGGVASVVNPEALVLADSMNNNSLGVDANSTTGELLHVNANKGGPSIGWGRTYAYVAVPATSLDDNATTAVYTRIQPESSPTNTYERDWGETASSSWLVDAPPENPNATIYLQPLNSSPTLSEGFSQPKLLNYLPQTIAAGGTPSPETLSNVFSAQMLFGRSQNNSAACSATNWCSVGYSGEYNTAGIRGWAWAEAIGWISLSCNNLNTCYNKSYDASGNAWSTKEGGFYYGVRAVTNPNISLHTLIGSAWSERAGYISFSRSTGVYSKNPCGNPPSGYVLTSVATSSECALLVNDLSADPTDTNVHFIDVNGAAVTLKPGSFIVDSEVIHFTSNTSGQPTGIRRGDNLANTTFKSITTAHKAGTPVFWINSNDVTTNTKGLYDIYRGINSFDPSNYQLDGWARAESWATYQREYCKNPLTSAIEIGSSYAAPCDKEWGWIKLSGNWSTVHSATVRKTPSNGDTVLQATSVDGYPTATTEQNELLYIPTLTANKYLWSYSGFETSGAKSPGFKTPALVANLPSVGAAIKWTATLAQPIFADTDTIKLSSVSGLSSSGKLRIREDSNPVDGLISASDYSEIVEYSNVNTTTKSIELVTRGVDSSTARNWGTGAFIEQINKTGTYNTFIIPMGNTQPERTLAGFGWSAPNTEVPTPDLTVSRYKDNIAGFGWLNFQPNQLEQIYPYLRTLFGNLYVGGDIEMVGPEYNSINPQQYTSTYQIQRNGSITAYINEQQGASSGQLQRCLLACNDDEECEMECSASFGSSEDSSISLDQGSTSTLGKIPNLDLISTMTSECQRWDSSSSTYVNAPCSDSNEKQAWQLGADINGIAQTGVNKYGQQVIICRAAPDAVSPRSANVFTSNAYNPPECAWELSGGFTGSVSAPFSAGQSYVCMSGAQGLVSDSGKITFGNDEANMNTVSYTKSSGTPNCDDSFIELQFLTTNTKATDFGQAITEVVSNPFYKVKRSHTGKPTVYVLPDIYGNEGQGSFVFDNTPLQFNNASEGQSGAITFVIPGSVFFVNMPMRYCPQGLNGIPCKAFDDIAFDSDNNPSGTKVTGTNQIASVAWLINGSATNFDGYNDISFYPELKTYRVGAFIVMGDETEAWKPLGQAGTYWSIYRSNKNIQLNVYGLVMARHFILSGEYYVQDENENVVEPSENIIYDGRVVVNPPPGLEDLASGLPSISQAVP